MNEQAESRLEEIFAEALARQDQERADYLDEACGDDAELRREVEELLAVKDQAEPFFDDLAARIAESASLELDTAARPRIQIGPYRAEEAIGRGGMGVVYRASRTDGEFDQQVALKLLHLDMQASHIQARFLAERQFLASFQHPHIAGLLDGGVTEDDRPYIVMEFIDGRPITTWCREQRLSLDESLRLFLQLVEAVSYLHRNLVVHRDLKPSNILVRNDGVVKLLDFGVAKLLGDETEGAATMTSERLLTPLYAAPEQLTGGAPTRTATDVYSLGVVLYELLTGALPHDRSSLENGGALEPTTTSPSAALRRERQAGSDNLPSWNRLPSDLDNICLKALRSEPERRYASAEGLGSDIERHLAGLPVRAAPDTIGYRTRKFVQRHWKGVSSALILLLLLVFGLFRERGLREETEQALLKAEAVSTFLSDLFSAADPAKAQGDEVTVIEVLERAEDLFAKGESFTGRPEVESDLRLVLGRTYRSLGKNSDAQTQLEEALRLAGGMRAENATAMEAAELLGNLRNLDIDRREALLSRVLEVRQAGLGPEHDQTLSAMSGLAGVYWGMDRVEEAQALDEQVYETRTRVFGPEHPDTLIAANNLAADYFSAARYEEAAALYKGALEVSRKDPGPSHPQTLRLMGNLGTTYSVLGRYSEAEVLLHEMVDEHLRVFGEQHHRTGLSMHNLALLQLRLGQFEEAEFWLRRAVVARSEASPAGYLFSKGFLADALRELGRFEEAETTYEATLASQKELLIADHPDTVRTLAGMAELYRRTGRLEEADEFAIDALADQQRISGQRHLSTSDTLEILARIRADQGRHEEALEFVDQAQSIRREVFALDHPVMLQSRLERVRVLAVVDPETARSVIGELADGLTETFGPDHHSSQEADRIAEQLAARSAD